MQREQTTAARQWALVLAGGDGTRLQEFTRSITGVPIPKQYCRILGKHSMLEATLLRLRDWIPRRRSLVVVTRNHLFIARSQLAQFPTGNVLVQPRNCDTGPGLLFSLLHLASKDPTAHVAIFPSDHYVGNQRVFIAHVRRAAELVRRFPEKIMLLGIRPDHCALGYGYVEPSHPLFPAFGDAAAFHVAAFQEKPDADAVHAILRRGGLWNSFVMVCQLQRVLALLRQEVPIEFAQMQAVFSHPARAEEHYRDLAPWNFSRRFLSHIPQHLAVLPVDGVHWSDWGTPEAIHFTLQRLPQAPPSWAHHLAAAL